jgi:hypothetical protein
LPGTDKRFDLSTNKKFTTIFKNAYSLLNKDGALLIGACYIDNASTHLKQEESYATMGMTVIPAQQIVLPPPGRVSGASVSPKKN